MPGGKGSQAPASITEGLNGIVAAIAAAGTAPDAGPMIPELMKMQAAVWGLLHKGGGGQQGAQPPQGAPPGGPPGAGGPPPGGMGGGTNIGQLMGGGGGPSAGPSGPSASGASAEDIRRMVASQAGTAG